MKHFPLLFWVLLGVLTPLALTAAPPTAPAARVVVTQVVEQELAATSHLVGIIDFDRISEVSGETSGLITRQNAVEGMQVKAGAPLVELNTDLIHKDMDIKQKQRAQVSADFNRVGGTLKRLKDLLQKNSASRQVYDDTRYELEALQRKRETLDEELARLGLQLKKSTVRAPFDGVILAKLKEQGEWINPGTPVCILASTADAVMKGAISEKLVRYQERGATLVVTIEPLGIELKGRIRGFTPVADLRSKSATLKVAIPYREGMIQNMSASVEASAGKKRTLRLIPRDAVVQFQGKPHIYTVSKGKAKMLPLKILARTGTMIGVDSPTITTGMPVVVDGNDRLRPNQAVVIIKKAQE
ncbi:MAG: efflux RND transporter periplasmic adaptor subunit [Sedimenticola sp.]